MKFEKLTECEELVMKMVWDAEEELSLMEVTARVNDKYHKDWKPQTVSTFLTRLVRKGYLRNYRQGRVFFYQILVPLDVYKGHLTSDYVTFWHHNNADEVIRTIINVRQLRQDEIDRIRKMVDGYK